MRAFCALIFIFVFLFPSIVHAQVSITEIMYDLPGGDTKHEWIEVHNDEESVDFSTWKLYEGSTNHKLTPFSGSGSLPSGSYAVIADDPATFLSDYPGFSGALFDVALSGGLNNTNGETLVLRDADLIDRDSVTYSPSQGAQGDGNSLNKTGSGWQALSPSPGTNASGSPVSKPEPTPEPKVKVVAEDPAVTSQETTQATTIAEPTGTPTQAPKKETPAPVQETVTQVATAVSTPSQKQEVKESEEESIEEGSNELQQLGAAAAAAPAFPSWVLTLGIGALLGLGIGGGALFLFRKKSLPPTE